MVLVPVKRPDYRQHHNYGREDELPVVLVTREPEGNRLPFVGADDERGVSSAVAHLAELGHERIAHLAGPPHLSTTTHRTEAFRRAMAVHLPGVEGAVVHGPGFTVEGGSIACRELLQRHPPVTAIVAGNDMMALGALESLAVAGHACPAEVSVVGHNDMPFMARVTPPLTTVAIPQQEIGARAARMLLTLRDGGTPDPVRQLVATTLVVRASTAPPP